MDANHVRVIMDSRSVNEAFARVAVAAFIAPLDPTYGELCDIKTAVSEAVTNAIIHGYGQQPGEVELRLARAGREITAIVSDAGVGIADVAEARAPLYTTRPEMERAGMGFTVMESFMDKVDIRSSPGEGTTVTMVKTLDS